MSTLFPKFVALKTRIGGNREIVHREETFGMSVEEQQHITPVPRHIVRILSETEFAIRLSELQDGCFDETIDRVLDILTEAVNEEGTLTKSVCMAAEQLLMPLAVQAKQYKVILAGHAHIDMNWMWSWPETVAATIATFTTMLNIMDEYPEFCFSQSQTSVYQIIDDYAPELKPRILARIQEGRWEVTSSAWVETDKNMPNTESLLRHIGYSKKYLQENWGIAPDKLEVDFSPDTFGHSANLPEIDSFGGVKYYYHCRGLDGDNVLFRWRGQSGKELLVYREPHWYNSAITPASAMGSLDLSKRCGGLKTGLAVYGVGDHGGGPTRRDVERGIEMQQWPVFPEIKFGTFREFFKEAESVRDKLPLLDREMNFIFTGCYTTQSRIKRGNRRSEAALSEAENALAFAHVKTGFPPHAKELESAWQKVLFTHFHDILTGSCVQDSREHAMGLYQQAQAVANTQIGLALSSLSAQIDTSGIPTVYDPASLSEGAGVGYNIERFGGRAMEERGNGLTRIWNVFNNTFADKEEPVEITVWDWTGDLRFIRVTDAAGTELPFQLLDNELQKYWDHRYFRILIGVKVPALSYVTVALTQARAEEYPFYFQESIRTHIPNRNYVLDNGLIRCEFDYSTGEMVSMKDAADGTEYLADGKRASPVLVDTQKDGMGAWVIGTYLKEHPITDVTHICTTASGKLRSGFKFDARIRGSKVSVEYTLDQGAKFVKAHIHADWSEITGECTPLLIYKLPLREKTDRFGYDIPAGALVRPAAEQDRPGLSYITAVTENGRDRAGIIADCKYGFRGIVREDGAVLIATLINAAQNPDPYPERGIHDIDLSIGLFCADPAQMALTAQSAVRQLTPVSTGAHSGTLPASGSLMKLCAPGAVPSAVYAQDGAVYVRLYGVSDEATEVSVDMGTDVKQAELVDLYGKHTGTCCVEGSCVKAQLHAHGVITVRIVL